MTLSDDHVQSGLWQGYQAQATRSRAPLRELQDEAISIAPDLSTTPLQERVLACQTRKSRPERRLFDAVQRATRL